VVVVVVLAVVPVVVLHRIGLRHVYRAHGLPRNADPAVVVVVVAVVVMVKGHKT
jgi:hypothetical protein